MIGIPWAIAAASAGLFLWLFALLGVVPAAHRALAAARQALRTLNDERLGDVEKERAARHGAVTLLTAFFSIGLRSLTAMVLAAVPVVAGHLLGVTSWRSVAAVLARADVLAATAFAAALIITIRVRRG